MNLRVRQRRKIKNINQNSFMGLSTEEYMKGLELRLIINWFKKKFKQLNESIK
jgi:hypothetical protein